MLQNIKNGIESWKEFFKEELKTHKVSFIIMMTLSIVIIVFCIIWIILPFVQPEFCKSDTAKEINNALQKAYRYYLMQTYSIH